MTQYEVLKEINTPIGTVTIGTKSVSSLGIHLFPYVGTVIDDTTIFIGSGWSTYRPEYYPDWFKEVNANDLPETESNDIPKELFTLCHTEEDGLLSHKKIVCPNLDASKISATYTFNKRNDKSGPSVLEELAKHCSHDTEGENGMSC